MVLLQLSYEDFSADHQAWNILVRRRAEFLLIHEPVVDELLQHLTGIRDEPVLLGIRLQVT
jgi:hypothetical protein